MARLRRILIILLVALVAGVGACNLLLPERFAVNAPMMHQLFGLGGPGTPASETVDQRMQAAAGLKVSVFASELPMVRTLRFTPRGHLLATLPRSGRIVVVEPDRDGDGRSDGTRDLLTELDAPYGIDVHDGWLYVALGASVVRFPFDDGAAQVTGAPETLVPELPEGGNHWTRTLRIGPDGAVYVTIGSSCNVCEESEAWRATMIRFERDGSGAEIYASGLRNSVGFDWQPSTGDLYATDNGRDMLGDDFPPCELNRIERGAFYGWPHVNGDGELDPDFGSARPDLVARSTPPAFAFRAHNAPLGMSFLRSPATPPSLRGAALAALHGSWNRTRKDGYKVVSLHWDAAGNIESRDFLTGFLENDGIIGRPVDIAQAQDGTIYVSDDYADVIWQVGAGGTGASSLPGARTATSDPLAALDSGERARAGARGAALYAAHSCAGCHEAASALPGVVPVVLAERNLAARYDIDSLVRFLAAPRPPMPLAPLDDAQRRDLAIHLLER